MNLRKRRRLRLLAVLLVLLSVGAVLLVQYRFMPIVQALSITNVKNETSNLINDAIDGQIAAHEIQYDTIVTPEKDLDGKITALKTDMGEVNRLKTEILDLINDSILDLSVDDLSIPLGSILFPQAFSGRGPRIPVKLMTIKSSGAKFTNCFTEAGINQTLHQIILTVSVTVTALTPNGIEEVEAESQVVVAQTVIVGEVPQTVIRFGDTQE